MKTFQKNILTYLGKCLSPIDALPGLANFTPQLNLEPSPSELAARKRAQDLAITCIDETLKTVKPGDSEKQTAAFIRSWLKAHNVQHYFHRPLVFFGDRTKYSGFTSLKALAPTDRLLKENDVFVIDFGPIVEGIACDVSTTGSVGEVAGYKEAKALLTQIREDLPRFVSTLRDGPAVWQKVKQTIEASGYEAIHESSAYSFFGHRLNGTNGYPLASYLAEKGKQTYTEFFARGLSGQLWSGLRKQPLVGIWAVEPHIGTKDFGVKFEEILVVTAKDAYWLRNLPPSR